MSITNKDRKTVQIIPSYFIVKTKSGFESLWVFYNWYSDFGNDPGFIAGKILVKYFVITPESAI